MIARHTAFAAALAAGLLVQATGSAAIAQTFRETELSTPKPSFADPRKVMLQLTSADETTINNVLHNAANIQNFYGMDQVEIMIVAYGPGMRALYSKSSPVQDRITSLQKYGIDFVGCGNTMDATDHTPDDLIEGVEWVQAGIAEIVERQLDGWVYVRP